MKGALQSAKFLISRLIDRPMRPLFPEAWRNETQIVGFVLSMDENDPDVLAVTAASAAAFCSDLPFTTPIAAVRVGMIDGNLMINPTVAEQKTSSMNIVVAGSEEAIVMVEAGALEVSEDKVADALAFGHEDIKKIIAAIRAASRANQAEESGSARRWRLMTSWPRKSSRNSARDCTTLWTPRSIPKKESYHRDQGRPQRDRWTRFRRRRREARPGGTRV